jgi:low affinity Fe/Cu permease
VQDRVFERMAGRASVLAGSVRAFALATASIALWIVLGPVFGWSDTWQLVVNTATTIVTFLMVFLIQHAQNKEMRAVQLKLNELIAAVEGASNRLIDVEDLSDEEIDHLAARFRRLARSAKKLHTGAHTTVEETPEPA